VSVKIVISKMSIRAVERKMDGYIWILLLKLLIDDIIIKRC
jgi:hypothetical protein